MHVVSVVVTGKQEMHYYCYKDQREGMKGPEKAATNPSGGGGESTGLCLS